MIKIKRMIEKLNLWKSSRTFGKNLPGRDGRTGPGAWGSFLRFLGFTSRQAPSHLVPQVAPPVAPSPVECSPEVAAPIEKNEGLMKG